jgi:hypothetical protein
MIQNTVRIIENYRKYEPKVSITKTVDRLVQRVPERYLIGLKEVILTNSGALNRKGRRQKTGWRRRKLNVSESFGSYHQEWQVVMVMGSGHGKYLISEEIVLK